MIQNNLHQKSLPLITQIINPVTKYYYQCTEETQRAINNLSMVLFFTVTVCGAIFAASICKFCFKGNYYLFVPVFALTAYFYYILDKPIIFSDLKSGYVNIKRLRIFIALVLGLFNSFLIDSFYFNDDIIAARNIEIKQKEKDIRATFSVKDSLLNIQKFTLLTQIDNANTALSNKREDLNAESDGRTGTGKGLKEIYKGKYAMYQADSIEIGKQNTIKLLEITKLDNSILLNTNLMKSQIENLPNETSTGINKSMELLHKVILLDGNFTNILMAILILIISMFFELAPIISKNFYDISEYFEKCMHQRDVKDKEASMVKNKELNIVGRRILIEQKRDETKMVRDNAESILIDNLQYNKDINLHLITELNRLETEDIKLKKRFPQYYETHIKPVLDRSYINLHNAAMEAISQK